MERTPGSFGSILKMKFHPSTRSVAPSRQPSLI
jgi:hypothetical protein